MGLTTLDSFNGVSMSSDIALHIFLTFCFCIYIDNTSSVHAGVPIKREWEGNQDSTASDLINSPSESNDSNFEEEQEEPKPCQSKYVKLLDLGLLTQWCEVWEPISPYRKSHALFNYNYDIKLKLWNMKSLKNNN